MMRAVVAGFLLFNATFATAAERPAMTPKRTDVKPFEYVDAKIPLYVQGGDRGRPRSEGRMQKPLESEESKKHFVTPKGFEVRTFVTEDKLGGKPLTMAWDERGRLWVSLTVDYPNELKPPGEGRDRIAICEDTDGDGVCDTVSTFADHLSIPTSILHAHGGVIVHSAPDTLFLKDTDGDGRADLRQVLFTGWGTRDTHAGPSNLRYGFDNWAYGMVGYSGFDGTVNGEKVNFKQGFYRFKAEPRGNGIAVSKLEFLRSTSNNSWGVGFSEDGQLFGSTANGCPLVHMTIPNRYYEKVRGLTPGVLPNIAADNHVEPITDRVRQVDWHGGFTAAAGSSLYTARSYPKEYWNRVAFVCEPTAHLVAAMVLEPDGATYKARYGWNLLASDDEWSAPIQAEVGPDGQVWVIDWYNFIVQHNPTPAGFTTGKGNAYETPLRDKTRGRIYRVVYTKAKPEPRVDLKGATPEKLVETLKNENMGWRMHAQRLLVERGKEDTRSHLLALFTDAHDEWAVTHGIGVLQGFGALAGADQEAVRRLIGSRHESVQRAALLASSGDRNLRSKTAPSGPVRRLVGPRSELALALAMIDSPADDPEAVQVAEELLSGGFDRRPATPVTTEAGLLLAMRHAAAFLLNAGTQPLQTNTAEASGYARAVERVAAYFAQGCTAAEVNRLIATLPARTPEVREAILKGLVAGWPAGKTVALDGPATKQLTDVLPKLPPAGRGRLLKLAAMWGLTGFETQLAALTKTLFETVADPNAAEPARLEAAKLALEFGPPEGSEAKLLDALTSQTNPPFATAMLDTLATSKARNLGAAVLAKLKDVPPAARPAALRLVLGRADSAKAFLDAVEAGTVRFDVLALDQKTALANHPNRALAARAKKLLALGGGLPNADRQKVIDDLAFVAKKTGNADAGKKVFTQHCAKCHKHGAEGAAVGPDLTGFGTHPKEEILIHLLDPSRSVEGNFKAYRATTADGRVIVGLLAAESKTAIELVDAEGKRQPLQRDNLESLVETDKSLMPEGFEKQAKPEELVDLLEFLARKLVIKETPH